MPLQSGQSSYYFALSTSVVPNSIYCQVALKSITEHALSRQILVANVMTISTSNLSFYG